MSRLVSYRRLKSLYVKSPDWAKRTYSRIPFAWRAGREYRKVRRLIEQTEHLPWEELRVQQSRLLAQMLLHASTHVPHYRIAFGGRDFAAIEDPDDVQAALRSLPFVEKRDIQRESGSFQATGGVGEPVYTDNTGGSSGTPFEFLKNNRLYPIEQACMMDQWSRVGYQPGARKLTLRGRAFPGGRSSDRWMENPIYNELAISSYHLDAESVTASFPAVRRFRPQFIHGYPSAIVTYLRALNESNLEFPHPIHAVLCGSEPLYEYQRSYIESMLGCRAFSWYGQSECVILAGECEFSADYHSYPLYGVLELIDDEGRTIEQPGIEGEIVGTSLNNRAMPFIRYRTGDRGIYSDRGECSCGRSYPRLRNVTGRKQHFIYTVHLRPIPVTAYVFGQHFAAFQRICAMQLVQYEPGRLTVRIVRSDGFSETDERELKDKMQSSVDGEIVVSFDYVESLGVNSAGKIEFVVQHVKEP